MKIGNHNPDLSILHVAERLFNDSKIKMNSLIESFNVNNDADVAHFEVCYLDQAVSMCMAAHTIAQQYDILKKNSEAYNAYHHAMKMATTALPDVHPVRLIVEQSFHAFQSRTRNKNRSVDDYGSSSSFNIPQCSRKPEWSNSYAHGAYNSVSQLRNLSKNGSRLTDCSNSTSFNTCNAPNSNPKLKKVRSSINIPISPCLISPYSSSTTNAFHNSKLKKIPHHPVLSQKGIPFSSDVNSLASVSCISTSSTSCLPSYLSITKIKNSKLNCASTTVSGISATPNVVKNNSGLLTTRLKPFSFNSENITEHNGNICQSSDNNECNFLNSRISKKISNCSVDYDDLCKEKREIECETNNADDNIFFSSCPRAFQTESDTHVSSNASEFLSTSSTTTVQHGDVRVTSKRQFDLEQSSKNGDVIHEQDLEKKSHNTVDLTTSHPKNTEDTIYNEDEKLSHLNDEALYDVLLAEFQQKKLNYYSQNNQEHYKNQNLFQPFGPANFKNPKKYSKVSNAKGTKGARRAFSALGHHSSSVHNLKNCNNESYQGVESNQELNIKQKSLQSEETDRKWGIPMDRNALLWLSDDLQFDKRSIQRPSTAAPQLSIPYVLTSNSASLSFGTQKNSLTKKIRQPSKIKESVSHEENTMFYQKNNKEDISKECVSNNSTENKNSMMSSFSVGRIVNLRLTHLVQEEKQDQKIAIRPQSADGFNKKNDVSVPMFKEDSPTSFFHFIPNSSMKNASISNCARTNNIKDQDQELISESNNFNCQINKMINYQNLNHDILFNEVKQAQGTGNIIHEDLCTETESNMTHISNKKPISRIRMRK